MALKYSQGQANNINELEVEMFPLHINQKGTFFPSTKKFVLSSIFLVVKHFHIIFCFPISDRVKNVFFLLNSSTIK